MAPTATLAQIKVIISGGFSGPYAQLLPEFEKTTGIQVTTGSGASQGSGPQTIGAKLARGVVANSAEMNSAKQLIAFLKSARAAAAIAKAGMEPLNTP